MRVTHFAEIAPNRCGLYGTARDLITAEKKVGIDAGIVDATLSKGDSIYNGKLEMYPKNVDPGLEVSTLEWAMSSDVFVRHSLLPTGVQNLGKPLVMAVHGRPESSYRLEESGTIPVINTFQRRGADKRYKAFPVFWKEYMSFWSTIIPKEKLFYIPAPVDLDYYAPFGEPYDLGEHQGSPNILICDIWRDDVIPLNMILAALEFQQKYCKTAKIHLLAVQGKVLNALAPILKGVKDLGALGIICGQTKEINKFYASADMVITPHVIATRIVRESLASGVPVVAGSGNKYTPYTANPMDVSSFAKSINDCWVDIKEDDKTVRTYARKTAEACFNPLNTGMAIKEMFEVII